MVVYGFNGTLTNPTHFHVMDPLSGPYTWTTKELMFNWSALGHMGVVVAKQRRWVRVPGETQVWEISQDGKTRRWVSGWKLFEQRANGHPIIPIDAAALGRYPLGSPIE